MQHDDESDVRADRVLARYLELRAAGQPVGTEDMCRAHPSVAGQLRQLVPLVEAVLDGLAPPPTEAPAQVDRSTAGLARRDRLGQWATASPSSSAEAILRRLAAHAPPQMRHRTLEELGRGGMGVVYRVSDDDLRRDLAMKVVRDCPPAAPGAPLPAATARRLGRFFEEAQVTAQLEHPGIVPVHELGLADDGTPFFTMRLVQGQTLADVLAEARAPGSRWTQTRLVGVLLKACEAVAHAHARGVVHRDLKPANIMVGDFGTVYVMDWGLAKVSEAAEAGGGWDIRTDDSEQTRDGDVLGTAAYMAPEQAAGDIAAVGPRADVYSLGAILYEVLTGTAPFTRPGEAVPGRVVLARVGRGVPQPVRALAPRVPAELEAICSKAMGRAPASRYADVGELADDLRAFLEQRVVRAYRTGAWVEAWKWVRRNKALAAALAAVVVALAAGVLVTAILFREAGRHARGMEQTTDFISDILLAREPNELGRTLLGILRGEVTSGLRRLGRAPEATEQALAELERGIAPCNPTEVARRLLIEGILGPSTGAIAARFAGQPVFEATIRGRIGRALMSWGDPKRAEAELGRAFDLLAAELGRDDPKSLLALSDYGSSLRQQGKYPAAEAAMRELMAATERVFGPDDYRTAVAASNLGGLLTDMRSPEALPFLQRAHQVSERLLGPTNVQTLSCAHNLGSAMLRAGDTAAARRLLAEAFERSRAAHPDSPGTINHGISVAVSQAAAGELAAAEDLLRELRALAAARLGEKNSYTLLIEANLGDLLRRQGRHAEAEALLRRAAEGYADVIGRFGRERLHVIGNLAELYLDTDRAADAEAVLRPAIDDARVGLGPDHGTALDLLQELARTVRRLGRFGEALALLDEGLGLATARYGAEAEEAHLLRLTRLKTLIAMGRDEEAEAPLEALNDPARTPRLSAVVEPLARDLLLELYDARAKARPGQGYEERAARLRAGRPQSGPTTPSPSRR